ncbi:G2/mitotic-specific cyclin-4 [Ceratocystis platani]|uniref:G2/mitotic-specific cyclin-4 n=1 Tax=Ceratocystis fimbriata f. sp. platani TaxID=88771 RepID=A0A0F8CVH9_CERFI|nr:G2/mitotic-specific cyclin-4 [Ceratocystis platani]
MINPRPQRSRHMWAQNENMAVPQVVKSNKAVAASNSSAHGMARKTTAKRSAFNDLSNTARGPIVLQTVDKNPKHSASDKKIRIAKSQIFNPVSLKKPSDENTTEESAMMRSAQREVRKAVSLAQFDNKGRIAEETASKFVYPDATVANEVYHDVEENDESYDDYMQELPSIAHEEESVDGSQPECYAPQPLHLSSQPVLRHSTSDALYMTAKLIQNGSGEHAETSDMSVELAPMDDLIEALYEDALEYHSDAETMPVQDEAMNSQDRYESLSMEDDIHGSFETVTVDDTTIVNIVDEKLVTTSILEPEEFWDEEEEEEDEQEGMYENGRLCCPFPKLSARVERDLDMAAGWVESSGQFEYAEDCLDINMVSEYVEDIFEHYHNQDRRFLPSRDYMNIQREIKWPMRAVLIDWVIQAHARFNLLPETLFLAVNCIDRFLAQKVVTLPKLQLVGATALFIAAKYEEINCPSLSEMRYIVDNSYSEDEIRKAERYMLLMLNFDLGSPGPMSFLRRISKADNYDIDTRTMAKYFLEVTLIDERFVGLPQSFLAAAAHCLSRMLLQLGSWSPAHVHYSGYTYKQLRPAVEILVECCSNARVHHVAVFEKYRTQKYNYCAAYVVEDIAMGFRPPMFHPTVEEMISSLDLAAAVAEERAMAQRE